MHFKLPDLADFPDYTDEPRRPEDTFDLGPLYEYETEGDWDKFWKYFLETYRYEDVPMEYRQEATPWFKRLAGYFKFYRTFKKPDHSVKELSNGIHTTKRDLPNLEFLLRPMVEQLREQEDWRPPRS